MVKMTNGICLRLFVFFGLTKVVMQCPEMFIDGKRFNDTSFVRFIPESGLYACAADCVAYSLCRSLSFNKKGLTCFLHLEDGSGHPDNFLNDTNLYFSVIKDLGTVPLGQTLTCTQTERCEIVRNKRRCVDIRHLLSREKVATASSIFQGNKPSLIVNGDMGSKWNIGLNCFQVFLEGGGWFQVDLGSQALITDVLVVNRRDCCSDRLRNFDLETFTEDPSVDSTVEARLCYRQPDVALAPGENTFNCTTPVVGRYFRGGHT